MSPDDINALAEAILASRPSILYYFSPLIAVLLSVAAAGIYADRQIKAAARSAKASIAANQHTAKIRSTMDFIMDRSRDLRFTESYGIVRKIHKDPAVDIQYFAKIHDYAQQIANEENEEKKKVLIEKKPVTTKELPA